MKKKLTLTNQNENEEMFQATFMEKVEGATAPEGKIAAKSQVTFTCALVDKPICFRTGGKYIVSFEETGFKSEGKPLDGIL